MERILAEAAKSRRQDAPAGEAGSSRQQPSDASALADSSSAKLPKGVVLGPDGKPCRTCTSVSAWSELIKSQRKDQQQQQPASSSSSPSSSSSSSSYPSTSTNKTSASPSLSSAFASISSSSSPSTSSSSSSADASAPLIPTDCPPDVERLGRHTWTLLHSMAATYPERASGAQQADMRDFLALFGRLYPCWACAGDFRAWMGQPGNAPRLAGREPLGRWMCAAHNAVNDKLGKPQFDCDRWRERWVDGWKDGRCDP